MKVFFTLVVALVFVASASSNLEFNDETFETIFGEKNPAMILFRDANVAEGRTLATRFEKIAEELKGTIIF